MDAPSLAQAINPIDHLMLESGGRLSVGVKAAWTWRGSRQSVISLLVMALMSRGLTGVFLTWQHRHTRTKLV